MYAPFRRESECLVASLIMKKLTAHKNNRLVVRLRALDLSIKETGQGDSRAFRRDWSHLVNRKQVVPEVIEPFAAWARRQRSEAQCSGGQGGEIELGWRLEIRIEQSKDIAAVYRLHVHRYSVVAVCFDPNLVVWRFAFRILLAILDLTNQYAVTAFGPWGFRSSVAHAIFWTPCCGGYLR